jgi:hypothetical protein
MAMILFANEIDSGKMSREQLLRLDGVTLNVSVMGEMKTENRTRIGLRAFLSGSFFAEYDIVLSKQYFNAFGDVIPYDEIENDGILRWFVRFFSAEGEYLVIDFGDALDIAFRGQTAEDREERRFRSILPDWEADYFVEIAEGERAVLSGLAIESANEHGIARVTINMPFPHDDISVSWDLPNMPMSANLDREMPTQNLPRGIYKLNVWASHSTEYGTGQRVGTVTIVVRPRVEITSFIIYGSSVTVHGNYFRAEQIIIHADRILDPYETSFDDSVRSTVAYVDLENRTFNGVIRDLPHNAWYRIRVEAVLRPDEEVREELRFDKTTGFFIGFQPTLPTPGHNLITSQFGRRSQPTAGASTNHLGIDLGAPMGARIVAAASGTVTLAGWNGGYGLSVIIDHGGGIITLYGHCSELLVSPGQMVSQGEPIARVGSTGVSTGPHLHFEIRQHGRAVNPVPYFPSGTFRFMSGSGTITQLDNQTSAGEVSERLLMAFANATYNDGFYSLNLPRRVYVGFPINYGDWSLVYAHEAGSDRSLHSGFRYLIFERGNDIIVAFRGTPLGYAADWRDSAFMIFHGSHPQHTNVRQAVQSRGKINDYLQQGRNVFITGHSLGGNLAVMAYNEIINLEGGKYTDQVIRIETFNGVGVRRSISNNIENRGVPTRIIHHYFCCDFARHLSSTFGFELIFVGDSRPPRSLSHSCVRPSLSDDGISIVPFMHSHGRERFAPLPVMSLIITAAPPPPPHHPPTPTPPRP